MALNRIAESSQLGMSASESAPALEVQNLVKSYGAVRALRGVSFAVKRGEVLGLLGDNGAGKSTLVKCLSGILKPDSGSILIHGKEYAFHDPEQARLAGIEAVHQNLELVPELDVAANMFLNRELVITLTPFRALGWLDKRAMYDRAEAVLKRFHVRVPSVKQRVDRLSGGQRQSVAVSRAVEWSRDIVLLDEPTAALGVEQSAIVIDLIRQLGEEGIAVLLVSHNMQHVIETCDRAVVLRLGEKVGDVQIKDVTPSDLVDLITGVSRAQRNLANSK